MNKLALPPMPPAKKKRKKEKQSSLLNNLHDISTLKLIRMSHSVDHSIEENKRR